LPLLTLLHNIDRGEAKRVPYADHIITLSADGKISEQGSFKDLAADGGYVSSFNLPPPEWNYDPKDTTSTLRGKEFVLTQPTQSTEDDASRRTGDVAIYLYYIRAVGWIPSVIFVIAISAFVFCLSFPSKLGQYPLAGQLLTSL